MAVERTASCLTDLKVVTAENEAKKAAQAVAQAKAKAAADPEAPRDEVANALAASDRADEAFENARAACQQDRIGDVSQVTYRSLSVTNDVAGGGTRANTYFLINLFVPAPHASYNGGAVVSYSFRNEEGEPQAAGTLRFVFGYGKWHGPPLRARKGEEGYANFKWARKKNRGGWIVWW